MEYVCPKCDEVLEEQEATSMFCSDNTEIVYVCMNNDCENYDEVVLYGGNLEAEE